MPRLPLEDNFTDVIGKAQRGLGVTDADLAARADVSREDLAAIKGGQVIDAVLRRVARHLGLGPAALEDLAHQRWYPEVPDLKHGFAMFNTAYGDMRVNSYLVWDPRSKAAAAFDTGADAGEMLSLVQAGGLDLKYLFLTHTHEDHVADMARMAAAGAEVWASEREPSGHPGGKVFRENAHFHLGALAIKTLATWGHSPGMTTYYITGLTRPLAIVGDSLFASSMGGSPTHFKDQHRNNREKILTLPRDTVLASGHGPLTTLAQELEHNPFLTRK